MRKLATVLGLMFVTLGLEAKEVRVFNALAIDFPADFEVISVDQTFTIHKASNRYAVFFVLGIVFDHSHLLLQVNLYGKGKLESIRKVLGTDPRERYNEYNIADQLKYLRSNYANSPLHSTGDIQYSRFFSEWGTDWSSDYLGYYFRLDHETFQECFIQVSNSWRSFYPTGEIPSDQGSFESRLDKGPSKARKFYNLVEALANSAKVPDKSSEFSVSSGVAAMELHPRSGRFVPTIDNLRWRAGPSANAEVFGLLPQEPVFIVDVGGTAEFDGIKGNWVRVTSGNWIGWVFDGYLRELQKGEMNDEY